MVNELPEGIEPRPTALAGRVLQGGPVALVTTFDRGSANVLPVAWHTPLSAQPPLVGVAIERSRHSARMIAHSEQYAINIPARALLHHVQYLGSMTGAQIDKFEATQFETFGAQHVDAPLLTGCLAWIECEVRDAVTVGDHVLYVGYVRALHVDPRAFSDRWRLDDPDARPLHFLGDHYYATLESTLEARMPGPSDAPERVLAERVQEELELSRDAQERRAEALDALQRDVDAGKVVDVSQLTTRPASPGGLVIASLDDLPPLP